MRLLYLDPALIGNTGHAANKCRYIVGACQARGIETLVSGSKFVSAELQAELGATPLFRHFTHWSTDGDPISGWLNGFVAGKNTTRTDLARLHTTSADVIFLSAASPAQVLAAREWTAGLARELTPLVVVDLGSNPGVDVSQSEGGKLHLEARDPRVDANGVLYRFAAQYVTHVEDRPFHLISPDKVLSDVTLPFHLISLDPFLSDVYAALMERAVATLPFPVPAVTELRHRSIQRPITISMLGHQQAAKGYHLLPDVIEKVLQSRSESRFLIHNADHEQKKGVRSEAALMREAHERLREIAGREPRLVLREGPVSMSGWAELLDATDLMLCPYDPRKYGVAHSGIAAASLANGIPFIAPKGTSLARWISEFGGPGATFENFSVDSVVNGLQQALDRFDEYAVRAHASAIQWAKTHGPANFVEKMLGLRSTDQASSETHRVELAS